jgi:hypothetical protein
VMVGPTPYKEAIPAGTEVRVADREFLELPRQIAKLFKGKRWLVGAVGIETASLTSKSRQRKALPTAPHPKC